MDKFWSLTIWSGCFPGLRRNLSRLKRAWQMRFVARHARLSSAHGQTQLRVPWLKRPNVIFWEPSNESFRFRHLRDRRPAYGHQRTQLDLVRIDCFAGNTLRALRLFLSNAIRIYGSGVRPKRSDANVQGQEHHGFESGQEQR